MKENENAQLSIQEREAVRKYMLNLIVIPGTLLAVVSFLLGFFINEVAKQSAYNEAYGQATSVIMTTAAEAAKTSGKIDALFAQANSFLVEIEETRKRVELSSSGIAAKVARKLSNENVFIKRVSLPIIKMSNNLDQKIKDERIISMNIDKKVRILEKDINEIKNHMKKHLDEFH